MLLAKCWIVKSSAQNRQRLSHHNLVWQARQFVSSGLPTGAFHQTAAPQDTHQLGDIEIGNAFLLADLGNSQAFVFPRQPQQAPQTAVFLGCQFHGDSPDRAPTHNRTPRLNFTSCPVAAWLPPTSCLGSTEDPIRLLLSHLWVWPSSESCPRLRRATTGRRGTPGWSASSSP